MEGMVLYVALVRVFVIHYIRYIIAFTVANCALYGTPHLAFGLWSPKTVWIRKSVSTYGFYSILKGTLENCKHWL